jgi:hypothetical protein
MFTLKKLALVGVAGLAAFAMSCSDDDGDDAGSWTGFNAIIDSDGDISLAGTIKANDGVVSKLEATVDGKPVTLEPAEVRQPNAAEVTLSNSSRTAYLDKSDVCAAVPGAATVTVKVIATIGSSVVSAEKSGVAIACNAGPVAIPLYWNVELSFAGTSYADVDEKAALGQTAARAASEDVDLAAFTASGAANKIYGPCDIESLGDCSAIVALYETALTSAAAIEAGKAAILAGSNTEPGVGITISNGKWFVLETSDGGEFAVQIKSSGAQTVTLDIYDIL